MSDTVSREAVIDRYEDKWAVVLFTDDSETPVNIARNILPKPKPREGTYLKIEMKESDIMSITIDQDATDAARKRIQEKLARLRRGDHLIETPDENP